MNVTMCVHAYAVLACVCACVCVDSNNYPTDTIQPLGGVVCSQVRYEFGTVSEMIKTVCMHISTITCKRARSCIFDLFTHSISCINVHKINVSIYEMSIIVFSHERPGPRLFVLRM